MRSWFAPFKRITESRGDRFNFEDLAGYVIIGFLSRLVGAVIRTVLILVGVICLLLTLAFGIAVYLIWAVLPFSMIGLIGMSISLFLI